MKKILLGICILLVGLAAAAPAEASSVVFTPNVIAVQVGRTFTLPVVVDPAGKPQYTVRLALTFPPDLLEITSFTFDPNWIAVPQPHYDLIDNKRGELIKTAGFPKGFSSPISFGTITFKAKGAGDNRIVVETQSFMLDASDKSTLESRSQVRIVITEGQPPKTSSIALLPNLPPGETNLFDVTLDSAGLSSSVAPGESVAFSVKLVNLGSQRRADVTLSYRLLDSSGKQVYAESETVAVDTTASFVKRIPVPQGALAGAYTVETSLSYAGQQRPAVSRFTFSVVSPSPGTNNNMLYVAGIGLAILLLLGILYVRRVRTRGRFVVHDYSDKPKEERIYYEIISDTIGQMRQRAGDRALEVATHTEGLVVDEKTGRVLELGGNPAKIVAGLVSGYEQALGKKVSFSFRRERR